MQAHCEPVIHLSSSLIYDTKTLQASVLRCIAGMVAETSVSSQEHGRYAPVFRVCIFIDDEVRWLFHLHLTKKLTVLNIV